MPTHSSGSRSNTLLIVGGGHASLPLIKMGKKWAPGLRVVLISAKSYLYYSGAIPQFMGGFYDIEETRINLQALAEAYSTEFHEGYVNEIQPDKKQVHCADGRSFSYDALVLNTGVVTRAPEKDPDSIIYPVKPMGRLVELQQKREAGSVRRLLIAGGGAAGVELALNISHPEQKRATPPEVITLIHKDDHLLPGFPKRVSRKVEQRLRARGVELRLGEAWDAGQAGDGDYDAIILATGNRPATAGMTHGLPVDEGQRIRAKNTLQVENHPEIFVAGDGARVGPGYPEVGVHAVKQGVILRQNVAAFFSGAAMQEYKPYAVNPLIISNGTTEGYFIAGKTGFSGRWAILLKYILDMNWLEKYTRPPETRRSYGQLLKDALGRGD
jgi:selenide,water dikinase